MEITINGYGTISVETNLRSIFDEHCAGQFATDGGYYCIHIDHKTHQHYALSKENECKVNDIGRPLDIGKSATFSGENVRGMTFEEECAWNDGRLMKLVDVWGNVCTDEKRNSEYARWYSENCI